MTLPSPSAFNAQLVSDRLETVSQMLLDELYATEDDLSRSTDSGYTRGCTTFGRQRSRIISEAMSGRYEWLGLSNGSNDIVFTIGGETRTYRPGDSYSIPAGVEHGALIRAGTRAIDVFEEPDRYRLKPR